MLHYQLLEEDRILTIHPEGKLQAQDFSTLAAVIDPFIEQHGALRGLLIEAPTFPGWKNMTAALAHKRFILKHHRKVAKIALVSERGLLSIMPCLMGPFVHPKIKHFGPAEKEKAMAWLKGA